MTTANWILAPSGRWTARDKVGNAAVGAFVFTYVNKTRTPKSTAQDPAGLTLNTNPIQLDSAGEAQVYWQTDEYYTIEIYSVNKLNPSVPFELIYTEDNYPVTAAGSGGDITIVQSFPNLIRNPQFTLWGNDDLLKSDTATTMNRIGVSTECAQDWFIVRNNTNALLSCSRQQFAPGQTDVPGNPIYFLNFQTISTGAGGEQSKALVQDFYSVTTLQNQPVSFGFWARSISSTTITASFSQYFGSGGSPSASVTGIGQISCALTSDWQFFSRSTTINTINGKNIGTNGDDRLRFNIEFQLNINFNVDIVNVEFHNSSSLPTNFPYLTVNDQQKLTDHLVTNSTFKTGDLKTTIRPYADDGWLIFDDSTFGSNFSGATHADSNTIYLFQLIWNQIPSSLCTIYNSNGTIGTRGADAITDFNADKRLDLPRSVGRVLVSAGISSDVNITPYPLGTYLGVQKTTLIAANLPPHTHETYAIGLGTSDNKASATNPGNTPLINGETGTGATLGLNSTPVSIMQPTLYVNVMIKI